MLKRDIVTRLENLGFSTDYLFNVGLIRISKTYFGTKFNNLKICNGEINF